MVNQPYIAAFMAFSSAVAEGRLGIGKRVAIWALSRERFAALDEEPDPEFQIIKTRLIKNDRVWRQSGLFIEHTGDGKPLDLYLRRRAGEYEETGLAKWTIPSSEGRKALNDLVRMGINPATVYADRDGAAKYVRLRMALDRLEESS